MHHEWKKALILHSPATVSRPLINVRLKSLNGSCGDIQGNNIASCQAEAVCAMPSCLESGCGFGLHEVHKRMALAEVGFEIAWQVGEIVCTCKSALVELVQELLLGRAKRHISHNQRGRWTVKWTLDVHLVLELAIVVQPLVLELHRGRWTVHRGVNCHVHFLHRNPDLNFAPATGRATGIDIWEEADVAVWVHAGGLLVVRQAQGVVC
jgi:hypothetical protein